MRDWLKKEKIPFRLSTLYELIIQFKPRNVRYSVDEILETACHTPL
jgi:hypothetical protein